MQNIVIKNDIDEDINENTINNNFDDMCINNVDSNKHKSKNISHIKIIDNNKNIINNKSNYIKTQSNTKNNSEKTSETDSNKSRKFLDF